MKNYLFISALFLFLGSEALGNSTSSKRFGLYASVLGDPYPSLIGINLGLNLFFLRVTAGAGTFLIANSVGASVKALIPGWRLTPVIGVGRSRFTYPVVDSIKFKQNGNTVTGIQSIQSHKVTETIDYGSIGLEYTAPKGFHAGVGYNQAIDGSRFKGYPYVNVGWFF